MKTKIKHGPEYVGQLISYKVSGPLDNVKQVVKEYQPVNIIFVENSKNLNLEECSDTFVEVYLLFNEEQAMLLRLSSVIDKY